MNIPLLPLHNQEVGSVLAEQQVSDAEEGGHHHEGQAEEQFIRVEQMDVQEPQKRGPPDRAARARTRQPEDSKRAHLSAPALQTPPKFHETPREGRKERILRRDSEKKREILGPPPFGPLPFGAPTLRGPHLSGPPPFGAPPLEPPPFPTHTLTQNTQKNLNN